MIGDVRARSNGQTFSQAQKQQLLKQPQQHQQQQYQQQQQQLPPPPPPRPLGPSLVDEMSTEL